MTATALDRGLELDEVRIAYGGNIAVDSATLAAPCATITGLIGPNGAGKTSLFNACNGLLRPANGRVLFGGRDVTRDSTAARARAGLGRTFQVMQLVTSMAVRDNVILGAASRQAGRNPLRHVALGAARRAAVTNSAIDALDTCGIADLADAPIGSLSTGQRRLVELARVVAGGFRLLLLDEPSSGLDEEETARFGDVLRTVVVDRGTGILLVEHDMSLVMSVCSAIFVLDFGRMIFQGSPAEVTASPVVQAAYLGGDVIEAAVEA